MIRTTTTTTTNVVPPEIPMGYPAAPYQYIDDTGREKARSPCVRWFCITMIGLIIVSCIASFISWLILRHTHNPVFRVERLAVSGFNVTNPQTFTAEWGTNVIVENPNRQFKVYIDQVECSVYHKDDFLASSSSMVDPVYLSRNGREGVEVEMKTSNPGQPSVGWWVVDEMRKERDGNDNGTVSFDLRMMVGATFKAGVGGSKHASLKVSCEGLNVSFVGNETSGVFVPGDVPRPCLVQDV